MVEWCRWLHDLSVSQSVRETSWLFPTLEWIYIYSMVFLVTVIASVDLRLMGFTIDGQPRQSLSQFSKWVLRWASVAFGVNALTGALLFASKAPDYYANSAFRIKVLLLLVGVAYHWTVLPIVARREDSSATVLGSKLAGGVSLPVWVGVIAASRWIAFV